MTHHRRILMSIAREERKKEARPLYKGPRRKQNRRLKLRWDKYLPWEERRCSST